MIRNALIALILIAGCGGPPLAQAQYCSSSYRSYGYRSHYVAPYRAVKFVRAYQPLLSYYAPGLDIREDAVAEKVAAKMLQVQLLQYQNELARMRQQLQQAAYAAAQPTYQQPYDGPQQRGYTAPQAQGLAGLRVRGEFDGEIYQDQNGASPQDPGAGVPPASVPGGPDQPQQPPPQANNFKAGVVALLSGSCVQCHQGATAKAGIDLTGDPDQMDDRVLYRALLQVDLDLMPPKNQQSRRPVTDEAVQNFKAYMAGR